MAWMDSILNFDLSVYKYISLFISPGVTHVMRGISFFASVTFLVSILVLAFLISWKNKKHLNYCKVLSAYTAASVLLNELLKSVFQRPRPNILRLANVVGFSFPSGHSMWGLFFYGFAAYICYLNLKKPWGYIVAAFLFLFILFVGISRIYLGVHYASDVLAGFLCGAMTLGLAVRKVHS